MKTSGASTFDWAFDWEFDWAFDLTFEWTTCIITAFNKSKCNDTLRSLSLSLLVVLLMWLLLACWVCCMSNKRSEDEDENSDVAKRAVAWLSRQGGGMLVLR